MKRIFLALTVVWLGAGTAWGGMVVQTWGPGKNVSHPGSLKVAGADGGAVIEVDLSKLPAGIKVLAARLFMERAHVTVPPRRRGQKPKPIADDALVACEVYAGDKPAGKPLEIVGPWFNCLDATAAVARAAGGRCTFFIKPLPGWKKDSTFLEVSHQGQAPGKSAPRVAGLKAVHRGGQTFISFKEIEDLAGADGLTWKAFEKIQAGAEARRRVRYHVYRGAKPITAETLDRAERIAVLSPLSGWNVHGRNSERAIDLKLAKQYALIHGHWNPFADARADGRWGVDCPLDRFVIPAAKGDGRLLASDEGLYVHTAAVKAKAYYAVIASINGTANAADLGPGNALARPVTEAPGRCEPVFQRQLPDQPFWNYPDKRLHYVHWAGPAHGNRPSQYYNWSVAVPEKLGKAAPLELSLPREDRSYWRTQYRLERDSIVITPYDWPVETWWYGYHEALGTLKSFRQGVVRNYTERRLLWFVDWAAKTWPVDTSRILVTAARRSSGGAGAGWSTRGCSTGGALHLGLRGRKVFSSVQVGYNARPDYAAEVADSMVTVWGKPAWAINADTGKNVWDELNLIKLVTGLPPGEDLPLVTMTGRGTTDPQRAFYNALLAKGQPFMANFGYWGGPKLLPASASGTWPAPMMRLDVRRNRPLPAFRVVALERVKGTSPNIPPEVEKARGQINTQLRWSSDDAVDKPDRVELTVWAQGRRGVAVTTDVIVRRRARFTPAAGTVCPWQYGPKDGPKQSGELKVGPGGLLVVPGVKITAAPGRLIVTAK